MSQVTLTTLEGQEVALASEDHATLSGWPGIDLTRLHVVDDEVYAEVRGKRHEMSLEAMLAERCRTRNKRQRSEAIAAGPTPSKYCRQCAFTKPLTAFDRTKSSPDGHMITCNACRAKNVKAREDIRAAGDALAARAPSVAREGGLLDVFIKTGYVGAMKRRKH